MVPARPTIQQTFSEGEEPARRSVITPLGCRIQVFPASAEKSMSPAGPIRQETRSPGAEMMTSLMELARRISGFLLGAGKFWSSCLCRTGAWAAERLAFAFESWPGSGAGGCGAGADAMAPATAPPESWGLGDTSRASRLSVAALARASLLALESRARDASLSGDFSRN